MNKIRLTVAFFALVLFFSCQQPTTSSLTYIVSYVGNGNTSGTAPVDSNSYESFDTVTVARDAGTLVKDGYSLAGWMTLSDGTGISYAPGTVFAMGSSNVSLYAIWIPNSILFMSAGQRIELTDVSIAPTGAFNIPIGVTAIGSQSSDYSGNGVFFGNAGMTAVTIPPSVTTLGDWAFGNCTGLLTITVPANVTSIGSFCFGNVAFTSMTVMNATPPLAGSQILFGTTGVQIKVPAGSVSAYKAAPGWSTYAANIVSQ